MIQLSYRICITDTSMTLVLEMSLIQISCALASQMLVLCECFTHKTTSNKKSIWGHKNRSTLRYNYPCELISKFSPDETACNEQPPKNWISTTVGKTATFKASQPKAYYIRILNFILSITHNEPWLLIKYSSCSMST